MNQTGVNKFDLGHNVMTQVKFRSHKSITGLIVKN